MAVRDKYIIDVEAKGIQKTKTQMNTMSGAGKKMAGSLGVAAAAYLGTQGLISAIQGSINAYSQQEMAEQKLRTALGKTSHSLLAQAEALQRVTTFGDEAIIAQQAFLGSIGFTEEKISELIPVALDLASATGQTLEFAVRNLAKTYSGLTGELGELIPQTKELTAEELKAGGALQVISDLMGGSAEKNTQTMTGSLEQMKNAVGDAAEAIGEVMSPIVITSAKVIKGLAESLSSAIDDFDRFMNGGLNVSGILTKLEYDTIQFNNTMLELGDNQGALIKLGDELVAEYNELASGSVVVTEEMKLLMAQIDEINLRLQEMGIQSREATTHFEALKEVTFAYNQEAETLLNDFWTKRHESQLDNYALEQARLEQAAIDTIDDEVALQETLLQIQNHYDKLRSEDAKKNNKNALNDEKQFTNQLSGIRGTLLNEASSASKLQARIQQATIIANTASAAMAAISPPTGAPTPTGFANMAKVIAIGAAQALKISEAMGDFDKFEQGGLVGGRRHSSGGTIIEAEQGEFVLNRNAVSAIGVENLNKMNSGSSVGSNINISINGGMISQDFVENELAESIKDALRRGADFGIS